MESGEEEKEEERRMEKLFFYLLWYHNIQYEKTNYIGRDESPDEVKKRHNRAPYTCKFLSFCTSSMNQSLRSNVGITNYGLQFCVIRGDCASSRLIGDSPAKLTNNRQNKSNNLRLYLGMPRRGLQAVIRPAASAASLLSKSITVRRIMEQICFLYPL